MNSIDGRRDTILITFGAGGRGWKSAARRIQRTASKLGIFSNVLIFDESWIQTAEPSLWDRILSYFRLNQFKGFGYWMWKPALLRWADQKWPDHQILYIDAGFEINPKEELVSQFKDFLEMSWDLGGIAFEQMGLPDDEWTKVEVFDYLEVNQTHRSMNQLYAGFICLPPGRTRRKLTNDFYELTKIQNGILFNDDCVAQQARQFKEHRHDQSIFSILWRQYELETLEDLTTVNNSAHFLFTAARNRTGISAKNPKLMLKLLRILNKIIDAISRSQYK